MGEAPCLVVAAVRLAVFGAGELAVLVVAVAFEQGVFWVVALQALAPVGALKIFSTLIR